jgi:tetratricopeptide (TPR) repeat protein
VKTFENPENAGKYLIILREKPKALFVVAKLAERISYFFKGNEEKAVFNLFLKSIRMIKDSDDASLKQGIFILLKNAIEKRMDDGDYEVAASLISEFYNFGFKNLFRKILFITSELAEKKEFSKSINILNQLTPSPVIIDLKTQILIEWGKYLIDIGDYNSAEMRFKEALKLTDSPETRSEIHLLLSGIYVRMERYKEAYELFMQVDAQSPKEEIEIQREIARILLIWGKSLEKSGDVESALEKYSEAYQLAFRINDHELTTKAVKNAKKIVSEERDD